MQNLDIDSYVKNTFKNQMKHYGLDEDTAKKLAMARFKKMEELKKNISDKDLEIERLKLRISKLENSPDKKLNDFLNDFKIIIQSEIDANLKDLLSPECNCRDYLSGRQIGLNELNAIYKTLVGTINQNRGRKLLNH
jgi:hypothetical protein